MTTISFLTSRPFEFHYKDSILHLDRKEKILTIIAGIVGLVFLLIGAIFTFFGASYYFRSRKVIQKLQQDLTETDHKTQDAAHSRLHISDKNALDRYYELLALYPKLKREGDLNNYTKGTYQIVYDPNEIQSLQKEYYQRLYNKNIGQEMTAEQAHERAVDFSRIGVVCEDQFWIWIRDAVISPSGFRHTYNRMIQKADLDRVGGAATLPIITTAEGEIKLALNLEFRHATQSWEFEIPRGFSNRVKIPQQRLAEK